MNTKKEIKKIIILNLFLCSIFYCLFFKLNYEVFTFISLIYLISILLSYKKILSNTTLNFTITLLALVLFLIHIENNSYVILYIGVIVITTLMRNSKIFIPSMVILIICSIWIFDDLKITNNECILLNSNYSVLSTKYILNLSNYLICRINYSVNYYDLIFIILQVIIIFFLIVCAIYYIMLLFAELYNLIKKVQSRRRGIGDIKK